jgi:superfamily II DNA or RNA helicase
VRRRFTKAQRIAVQLVQDTDGEADHIKPFSCGGATTVENCQLMSPTLNKKKGAFDFKPREWQEEFLQAWGDRKPAEPFMLIAIPAGGKTWAALEAARRWTAAAADRRVIVVVPTDNVKRQWKGEAVKFGMELQTKEFGTKFKEGFLGAAVTYNLVSGNTLLFCKLCSVGHTMVIFDEIHHCADIAFFGKGVKEAFSGAKAWLCMSGTPWSPTGQRIPFVNYDVDGYAIADFRYDLPRALVEEVVRYLAFYPANGSITNEMNGEIEELNINITDVEAAFRLRRILDPDGDYVRLMIADAHQKLMECRNEPGLSNAGALAICIDQYHAARIAKTIKAVTKCDPSIIVSDSDLTTDDVENFRKSEKEWLVAVRQVSEGTDIKRLQILCYLTNTVTELFFRQVLGRISRVRGEGDLEGYVYFPADPRLIRYADNIKNSQVLALKTQAEGATREIQNTESPELGSYTTSHDGIEMVKIGDDWVSIEEEKKTGRVAKMFKVTMQQARGIFLAMNGNVSPAPLPQDEPGPSKEDVMDKLRKDCGKAAFRLSKKLDCHVREIHRKFPPQEQMTEQGLRNKLQWLVNEYNKKD